MMTIKRYISISMSLLILIGPKAFSAPIEKGRMQLEVFSLGRLKHQKQNQACLGLRFFCNADNPIEVVLQSFCGKGVESEMLFNHKKDPGSLRNVLFANFHYQWVNQKGKTVLEETAYANQSEVKLKKEQCGFADVSESAMVYLPIVLPTPPGKYNLKVQFDNTALEDASQSRNNMGVDGPDGKPLLISKPTQVFEAIMTEQEIVIN